MMLMEGSLLVLTVVISAAAWGLGLGYRALVLAGLALLAAVALTDAAGAPEAAENLGTLVFLLLGAGVLGACVGAVRSRSEIAMASDPQLAGEQATDEAEAISEVMSEEHWREEQGSEAESRNVRERNRQPGGADGASDDKGTKNKGGAGYKEAEG